MFDKHSNVKQFNNVPKHQIKKCDALVHNETISCIKSSHQMVAEGKKSVVVLKTVNSMAVNRTVKVRTEGVVIGTECGERQKHPRFKQMSHVILQAHLMQNVFSRLLQHPQFK